MPLLKKECYDGKMFTDAWKPFRFKARKSAVKARLTWTKTKKTKTMQ